MNRIKELRKNKKITQEVFCKSIGISQGALSGWENERYEPDLKSVHKMADYFNVTVDYLLGRDTVLVKSTETPDDHLDENDRYDIARRLDEVLEDMSGNEALMFNGEILDEETKELVKIAIEESIKMAMVMAKKDAKKKKSNE